MGDARTFVRAARDHIDFRPGREDLGTVNTDINLFALLLTAPGLMAFEALGWYEDRHGLSMRWIRPLFVLCGVILVAPIAGFLLYT
jgi:hypothetical protein